MTYSQRHLIALFVALDILCLILQFSFRKWSDSAIYTNFTLHVFQFVEQLFTFRLFFLILR